MRQWVCTASPLTLWRGARRRSASAWRWAQSGSVVAMVMRGAMIQTALGLVIGVPVALLCVRFVKAQLYDVTGADASVLTSAILTLAVAACVAGLIPARRA